MEEKAVFIRMRQRDIDRALTVAKKLREYDDYHLMHVNCSTALRLAIIKGLDVLEREAIARDDKKA